MTCDAWREGNILSKFQVPSSYGFGVKGVLKMLSEKDRSLTELFNEIMTKVFVEKPSILSIKKT